METPKRKKIMALILVFALIISTVAFAQAPVEVPSDAPTEVPTEMPTDAPTEAATSTPTETPTVSPSEAPSATPIETSTEVPTVTPTEVPTENPTEIPTEIPTATATATETPTEIPTEAPTEVPTETPLPWDESICDHANAQCEQAPKCELSDCVHITYNKLSLPIPACALGLFLLDRQDALNAVSLRHARTAAVPLDLDIDDAPLYRSGNYRVTGGANRNNANITIKSGRTVSLALDGVTAKSFVIEDSATLILETIGANELNSLLISDKCSLSFLGSGAVKITSATQSKEDVTVSVQSGSVFCADLTDTTGRIPELFNAQNTTSVSVNEESYPALSFDNYYCLYLTPAAQGTQWTASAVDNTLYVSQTATPTQTNPPITDSTVISTSGTYHLNIASGNSATITINAQNVTVYCSSSLLGTATIEGTNPCKVVLSGKNTGTLISSINATTVQGAGSINVSGDQFASLVPYPVSGLSLTQQLYLDGVAMPLLVLEDSVLLPVPQSGFRYQTQIDGNRLLINSVSLDIYFLTTNLTLPSAGNYTISGYGSTQAVNVSAPVASVLTFIDNCQVTTLACTQSTITTQTGRLDLVHKPDGSNALVGNIRIAGDSTATIITVKDASGSAVANTAVTLRLNDGTTLKATTFEDGTLHLHGFGNLNDTDLAITDGSTVFTAVVEGGNSPANPGFDFLNISAVQSAKDKLAITYTVPDNVQTIGIMYKMGDVDLPDYFDAATTRRNGSANIVHLSNLSQGQTLTYRLFGTSTANAKFNEKTQDGFSFSQAKTVTLFAPELPDLNRPYTGHDYVLPELNLPEGITASFEGNITPRNAGQYVLIITVPSNHSTYAAYTLKVPFTISKVAGEDALEVTGAHSHIYNARPIETPSYTTLTTAKVTVTYYRIEGKTRYKLKRAPSEAGQYQLVYHIGGDQNVTESTVSFDYTIQQKPITIYPEPNQMKYESEEDPEFFPFSHANLFNDDTIEGTLLREEGEDPGNYTFLLSNLDAGNNYRFVLEKDAPTFLIMPIFVPNPIGGGTWERIDPIHQIIFLKDGRKLDVILNTTDALTFSYIKFGTIMHETQKNQVRPLSPSMRFNEATQEVLLVIRAEAELNDDHGYVTDDDGNLVYTGRCMRLSFSSLNILLRKGVTHIGMQLKDISIMVRITDLLNDSIKNMLKTNKLALSDAVFYFTIEPVPGEGSAIDTQLNAAKPLCDAYAVSVEATVERKTFALDAYLESMTVNFSSEETIQILDAMGQYDEEKLDTSLTLSRMTDDVSFAPVPSTHITPHMPIEDNMPYSCILTTHRYLSCAGKNGFYTITATR